MLYYYIISIISQSNKINKIYNIIYIAISIWKQILINTQLFGLAAGI